MLANLPHVLAHFSRSEDDRPADGPAEPPSPPSAALFLLVRRKFMLCSVVMTMLHLGPLPQAPPHVHRHMRVAGDHAALLCRQDSGAGGVEVMFHARAVEELALQQLPRVSTHSLKVARCCLAGSLLYHDV